MFSEKNNTKIHKETITTTVFLQHSNTSVRVCSYYFGRLVDSTIALITQAPISAICADEADIN